MDPRVARTRESLQDALFALAREHALDEITVGDITERAGVNRSSFYQHYTDKDSLLADALGRTIDDVSATMFPLAADAAQRIPSELLVYLDHVADNSALYRRVLGDQGSAIVAAGLRRRIEGVVRTALSDHRPPLLDTVPLPVAAAAITGSAMGVISAWVARDPLPSVTTAGQWLWAVLAGLGEDWGTAAP